MNAIKFLSISILAVLSVSVSSQNISTTISNLDPEIIQQGVRSFYAILRDKSSIRVNCAKINGKIEGTIFAFINKIPIASTSCNSYYNSSQIDNLCINKTFIVDLNSFRSDTQFNIECRIVESGDIKEIIVYQLFEDYLPRTRQGSILYNNNSSLPSTYNISVVPLSCEVIGDVSQSGFFDEIGWFPLYNANNLNMTTDTIPITNAKRNYTTTFQITTANQALYTPDSFYRCCTLYLKSIRNCQIVKLLGSPSTLTTQAPTTTTATKTTVMNSTTTTIRSNSTITTAGSNATSSNTTQSKTTIVTAAPANQTTTQPIVVTTSTIRATTTNNGNGQFTNPNSFSTINFITRFNILFTITLSVIFLY